MSLYKRGIGSKRGQGSAEFLFTLIGFLIVLAFVIGGIYVLKSLQPWWAKKTGESELAQAEQNRQIAVLEATAKKESAVQLAQAEIERAKGVAEANRIIGESLQGNEDYLRYLWIVEVAGQSPAKTTVYIPTEANIPILEARSENGQ